MNTQEFIKKYKKKLFSGADYFNPDTSTMTREQFDSAKCRFLLVFPTPHYQKAVSATAAAINDFVIEHCPDVFIDFAYMPETPDIGLYDDNNIPYAIGNITHLDPSHFDIVGFSISILTDNIAACVQMASFQRCDKPIPTFWSQRKDLPLGQHPLILTGGITAAVGDIMYGEDGCGNQSFMDLCYLGDCSKLDILFKRWIEAKNTGKVTRDEHDADVPGIPHVVVKDFVSEMPVTTTQDLINAMFDQKHLYQPQAYEVKYDEHRRIISNHKINPYAQDWVRPYYPHILAEDLGVGRSIINGNGDAAGNAQTQISEGCSASGQCSFCSEGAYTGGWVEKTKERILWEVRETKKYNAGYSYKPYSFNGNYITDYKGMLVEFRKIFPKVQFINMRMEELGRDVDAIKMMKLVGANKIAAPIEGISPRVQNNMLNKCLSTESLRNFMEDMVHAKMTDIKVGMIFTAYEEEEDFQWLYDFVMEMKGKAGVEGGKFPIRINCTPLIHYPLTALEFLERKSAFKSYNHIHWFSDKWYDKYFEANMRVKVHGFSYSTFIEQSLVDLGRALTPMIYKHFIKTLTPIMTLRNVATPEFVEDLKNFIDPEYHFADRDPEHYISPCHRIHIEMIGSYMTRARRLLRYKREGRIFENPPDIRCLKTYEGAKVKCMKDSLKDDPLFIYNDVDLIDGNLVGASRPLIGCERCVSKEEQRWRLTRPMPETANSDTVRAQPALRKAQKIRFVIKRSPEFDILNPNNTAHTFLCQFLQLSDHLLDTYHSVEAHSMQWNSDPGYHYFTSGTQIVDTYWQEDVISEIRSLIPQVNERLKSIQVVSATDILSDEKLKITDEAVYYFETVIPREIFDSAMRNYKGTIKVEGVERGTFEIIEDPNLTSPVFAAKGGKTIGLFHCPVKYNPLFYMSGFISTVKKIGTDLVGEQVDFQCMTVGRASSATCKHCSEEKAFSSLVNNKPVPMGFNCYCKAMLTALLK